MIRLFTVIFILLFSFSAYCEDGILKAVQEAFELYSVGNFEEAAPLFEEAAQMMKENAPSDIKGRLKVSLYAGLSYRETGDYQAALTFLKEAYNFSSSLGDEAYSVKILVLIAENRRLLGDYEKSAEDYLAVINSAIPQEKENAVLYYGLAESYRLDNKADEATGACDKAEEIAKKYSFEKLYLSCVIVKGEANRLKGDYAKSLQMFGLALDTSQARNYPDIAAAALNGLGLVAEILGRTDEARGRFEDALSLSIKNEAFDEVVLISGKILSLLPEKGSFSEKGDNISDSVKNTEQLKESDIKISLLKLASGYYAASSAYDKMYIASDDVYNEAVALGNDAEASAALYNMALALSGMEKYQAASDRIDEAISRAEDAEIFSEIAKMYALKSECFIKTGNTEDAVLALKEAIKSTDDENIKAAYAAKLSEIEELNE